MSPSSNYRAGYRKEEVTYNWAIEGRDARRHSKGLDTDDLHEPICRRIRFSSQLVSPASVVLEALRQISCQQRSIGAHTLLILLGAHIPLRTGLLRHGQ